MAAVLYASAREAMSQSATMTQSRNERYCNPASLLVMSLNRWTNDCSAILMSLYDAVVFLRETSMQGLQGVESVGNHIGLSDEDVLNLFARTTAVCESGLPVSRCTSVEQ